MSGRTVLKSGVSWSEPARWSQTNSGPDTGDASRPKLRSPGPSGKPCSGCPPWFFIRHGFHRFAEWIYRHGESNVEEHTDRLDKSVLALEQPAAWKALESFAEYGPWDEDDQRRVTWALTQLIATAPGRIWHGYHVLAVDDTKVLIAPSSHVWGTCTFHEYTARAAPTGPPPSSPTTGWSWAPCSPNPRSPAVPADLRPALLPAVAVAGRARRHRGVPDEARTGRRVAPRAGPHHHGQAPGRRRRRLRLGERGLAAGPARGRRARVDFLTRLRAMPGCSPCPCPRTMPRGEAGTEAQVG